MASTITVDYAAELTVTETFTGTYVGSDNTVVVNGLNSSGTKTGSTSVAVSKQASGQLTLSSGTGTLDLTALTGLTGDETVSITTLRAQFLLVRNKSTNANNITITKGGTNGWAPVGTSTFTIPLGPGQWALLGMEGGGNVVDSTHKTIDVSGTGSQILEWQVIGG